MITQKGPPQVSASMAAAPRLTSVSSTPKEVSTVASAAQGTGRSGLLQRSPTPEDNNDDAMRRHSKSCLANGFYSVGVGAPLPHSGAVSMDLSPSLRFLEHLTMEISVMNGCGKTRSGSKKQYAMTVHHAKTKASWRHCHSFDDYRVLHERLLELMEQGHFCMSECPYLYTFLKRSFPKPPHLLSFAFLATERAVDERRFAILRTLETLQSVLLNPNNHGCDVLTNAVATELVAFLYGEEMANQNKQVATSPVHPWEMTSPIGGPTRGFSASIGGAEELEAEQKTVDESSGSSTEEDNKICCSMCAMTTDHPVGQVLATWRRHKPAAVAAKPTASKTKTRSSSADTAVLSQFAATPRDSDPMTPRSNAPFTPPPFIPENAILSPPHHYKSKSTNQSKRFSLGETTVSMFNSLRQRVLSPVTSPYMA